MSVNSYLNTPWRIGKFKGNILKRAIPSEVLQREGRQVQMPKNNSNTYVARRFMPYGATATDANTNTLIAEPSPMLNALNKLS